MRKVLFHFCGLNDDDVERMSSTGTVQKVTARTVLVEEGGSLDSLTVSTSSGSRRAPGRPHRAGV